MDNYLGYTNPGIYINGVALPASTGIGWYTGQYTYADSSIASDLVDGVNWLYFDAVNGGGPAGLIFSADVSTGGSVSTIPEPSLFPLLLAAIAACGVMLAAGKLKRLSKSLTLQAQLPEQEL